MIIINNPLESEYRNCLIDIVDACNESDGTDYNIDDEPELGFFEPENKMAAFAYDMGDTYHGKKVSELLIFVRPENRRRHIASDALKRILPELRPAVMSEVYENSANLSFLKKAGAVKINDEMLLAITLSGTVRETNTAGKGKKPILSKDDFMAVSDENGGGLIETGKARLYYSADGKKAYIYGVQSFERGKGYGYELIEKALWFFGQNGFERAVLEVSSDNTAACNLYKKCGFELQKSIGCWMIKE